jgi:hypothetical protein
MRKTLLFLAILSALNSRGQKIPDPKPFANTITEADLKKHLYTIAGKEFEGRETATEGQRKAAAYIETYFKSLGLAPGNKESYQLHYPVYQDSLLNAGIHVNQAAFQLNDDFFVNPGINYTSTMRAGEVVFAGYGVSDSTHDDYAGINARGKVVIILSGDGPGRQQAGGPRRYNPYIKQEAAQKNGAIALLIIQNNFPRKGWTPKGNMYREGFRNSVSAKYIPGF